MAGWYLWDRVAGRLYFLAGVLDYKCGAAVQGARARGVVLGKHVTFYIVITAGMREHLKPELLVLAF